VAWDIADSTVALSTDRLCTPRSSHVSATNTPTRTVFAPTPDPETATAHAQKTNSEGALRMPGVKRFY